MPKIIGNTTATTTPRSDWNQTDETKADYIKNKPTILTEEDIVALIPSGSGGIPVVHELPTDAKDGDMCLYIPQNTLTSASGKRIYFDWEELLKPIDDSECTYFNFIAPDILNENITAAEAIIDRYSDGYDLWIMTVSSDGKLTKSLTVTISNGVLDSEGSILEIFDENGDPISSTIFNNIDELPLYFDIPEFSVRAHELLSGNAYLFHTDCRLMVYQGDLWSEITSLGSEVFTEEELAAAIENHFAENPIPVEVDPTLTMEGVAADAKATGDRLTDIEYQTVTTETAQIHSNLPEGNKTVTISGDGTWGDTVYAVGSADLIPRKTFNRTFPAKGITIEKSGLTYHISGTATAADNIHFIEENGNANIKFPNAAGKSFKMLTFSDKVIGNVLNFFVKFYDNNGATVQTLNKWGNLANQVSSQIGGTALTTVVPFSVPEDANLSYMKVRLDTVAGTTYDNDFQVYIVPDDETQTATLTNGIAEFSGITATDIMIIPYAGEVQIKAPIKSYIDYKTANAKGDTATYLTPEAFGAIGDGYTDDINAITACLTKAATTKQTVFMAQKYLISSPIELDQDGLNIVANDIIYSGNDVAIKIHSSSNDIRIHSIVSSARGLSFEGGTVSKAVARNNIEINEIKATTHGITFVCNPINIWQNTVRFNYITAGGDGCYGIAYLNDREEGKYITENRFYGGQIANCDWACHSICGGSKLTNIQVETNVKGGFYINGYSSIVNPRWAESNRDGEYPFLKFVGTQIMHITIDNHVPLPICEIDLSESDENDSKGRAKHEGHFAQLNFPIVSRRFGVGIDVNTGALLATQALVWGKYLILKPHMAYRKEVTTITLDTRLIGQETTEEEIRALSQLPTKFVVNTTNTEIYLHESYCAFGFNEFEVEQANGFTCKIYDKLNNLIFDGTEQGDGLYKLKVYKDATYSANHTTGLLRRDFLSHYWSVAKINSQAFTLEENENGNFSLVLGGGE